MPIRSCSIPIANMSGGSGSVSGVRRALVSGRLHVVHEDGTAADVAPVVAYVIEPGHDAWVVGDEPAVAFEFESAESYARG